MADTLHEFSELVAAIMKKDIICPTQFYYPSNFGKPVAELYKDEDWYINGYDGSQYYHGLQTKPPATLLGTLLGTEMIDRLNDRIATMDLPDYLRQIYPNQNNLYRLSLYGRYMDMFRVTPRGYIPKSRYLCVFDLGQWDEEGE